MTRSTSAFMVTSAACELFFGAAPCGSHLNLKLHSTRRSGTNRVLLILAEPVVLCEFKATRGVVDQVAAYYRDCIPDLRRGRRSDVLRPKLVPIGNLIRLAGEAESRNASVL